MKKYTMKELRAMSDEELYQISLEPGKGKNTYSTNANNAYLVRQERSQFWKGVSNRTTFAATLKTEKGRYNDGRN